MIFCRNMATRGDKEFVDSSFGIRVIYPLVVIYKISVFVLFLPA